MTLPRASKSALCALAFALIGLSPCARAEAQGTTAWLVSQSGPSRPSGVSPQSRIRAIHRQNNRIPRPTPTPTPPPRPWMPPSITPEALMAKRAAGDFWLLVDVRITGAYLQDRAAGAVSYPLELLFRDRPPPPPWPKGTQIALYCECPDESSSINSAWLLREHLGSSQGIHVLKGGLEAYMAAGYPVDEGPPSRTVPSTSPTPRRSASPSAAPSPSFIAAPSPSLPSAKPSPTHWPQARPDAQASGEPIWSPGWLDD